MYEISDDLSELQRCKRYAVCSQPVQRHVYTNRIAACANDIGVRATIEHLIPLLPRIAKDTEQMVRQDAAAVVCEIAQFLAEDKVIPEPDAKLRPGKAVPQNQMAPRVEKGEFIVPLEERDRKRPFGYQCLKSEVIPVVHTLLVDPITEVRGAASQTLVTIANLLHPDDVNNVILTMVLNLAHDHRDDQRTTAVNLMNELAPLFGSQLCEHFLSPEFTMFADDSSFRVRKATAKSFSNVCKTVGPEACVAKLLPSFLKLSQDLIWGVRRGCVDSMVDVASVVPDDVKRDKILPMFDSFRNDTSRWVRMAAFEVLGRLLYTLGEPLISSQTLQLFTDIPRMTQSVVDADVNFFCAFNFPAVTLALGPARWPELVNCFCTLSQDPQFPVRRTLAASLHTIAHIIGPELSAQHLVPVANSFFNDIDDVKSALIKNLAKFLEALPSPNRKVYLDVVWNFLTDKDNWRSRLFIARQLQDLGLLFSPDITTTSVLPLAFTLLKDAVHEVRRVAAASIGVLFRRLSASCPQAYAEARTRILDLCESPSYQDRQLFVRIGHGMLQYLPPAQWRQEYLESLYALVDDGIPNVRLLVASLGHDLASHPSFSDSKECSEIKRKLGDDDDADVKYFSGSFYTYHLNLSPVKVQAAPVVIRSEIKEEKEAKVGSPVEQTLTLVELLAKADAVIAEDAKRNGVEATDAGEAPPDVLEAGKGPAVVEGEAMEVEEDGESVPETKEAVPEVTADAMATTEDDTAAMATTEDDTDSARENTQEVKAEAEDDTVMTQDTLMDESQEENVAMADSDAGVAVTDVEPVKDN